MNLLRKLSNKAAHLPTSPRNPNGKENLNFKKVKCKEFTRWSVDDVCVWLESKGLGQYAEKFKRSKVNGESLVGLTDAQVRKELGIHNDLHHRSMMAARNALLGANKKDKQSVLHWSVEDVAIWLESHEIFTLRETFKKNAIHGALLMELTRRDLSAISVTLPLLVTKIVLLIQQAADGTTSRDKNLAPLGWSCAQVGSWLERIGLSRYKDVFESGSIDGLMLANVNDDMLDQLQVSNTLHRRSVALGLQRLLAREKRGKSKRERVLDWSAAKVAEWLSANDFDDRKLTFRNNGVHGSLLVGLTDQDLTLYLAMNNSIERSRLLRDIRHLCGEPADAMPQSPIEPRGRKRRSDAANEVYGPAPPLASDSDDAERGDAEHDGDNDDDDDDDDDDNDNDKRPASKRAKLPPPTLPGPPFDGPPCQVCRAAEADCRLGPCGHRVACMTCAQMLDDCPRCAKPIREMEQLD